MELLEDVEYIDVLLVVDKKRFYCNRQHLAKHSSYFAAMFNSQMREMNEDIIHLKGVTPSAVKVLIEYTYTEEMPKNFDNVYELLEAAAMYQFDAVKNFCVEFLQFRLHYSNCLGIMMFSDRLSVVSLNMQAKQMAFWDFSIVKKESELMECPLQFVKDYLSNDGLRVEAEGDVLKTIVNWARHRPEERGEAELMELLSSVRFSSICLKDMKKLVFESRLKDFPSVNRVVQEVWRIKVNRERQNRRLNGASTASITPPSNGSSEENETDAAARRANLGEGGGDEGHVGSAYPVERKNEEEEKEELAMEAASKDKVPSPARAGTPLTNQNSEAAGTSAGAFSVSVENVLALRLLSTGPRYLPMMPALIVTNEEDKCTPPVLVCYDHHERNLLEVGVMSKAFQKTNIALGFRACIVGKNVYLFGGEFMFGHNDWNNTVWRYDVFTKTWVVVSHMPSHRRHHSICVLNDCVYLIGGIGRFRVAVNTVDCFVTQSAIWTPVAPMPDAVHCPCSVAYQESIYVIHSNVWRYDPQFDFWCELKGVRLPPRVTFHTALPHANGIYLIGRYENVIFLFNPDERKWTTSVAKSAQRSIPVLGPSCAKVKVKQAEPVCELKCASENACILENKIFMFSATTSQLMVETYDITTGKVTVECESSQDEGGSSFPGASFHLGCFCIPRYS